MGRGLSGWLSVVREFVLVLLVNEVRFAWFYGRQFILVLLRF